MENVKKIYVVGDMTYYADFINNRELTKNIEEADIVLFTGGEDVDPSLYGCKPHRTTYSNLGRDLYEKKVFDKIRTDQLVVGICRGSQFLCVMNGGLLIQNVQNHAMFGTHEIYEPRTQRKYEITSTHHQMQYPYDLKMKVDYDILMYPSEQRSCRYEGDKIDELAVLVEPEVVLYHKENKPKCLAIQGHPEMMRKESQIVIRLNEIINELVSK
ncbi:MAG: gamma-glutamyl-gamma-aminobutyrate hydrolase family protein [Bacteroidales bacterium]|nr:gamma-glutamyl-gamma-aminobutyrate hydrolase family protein [Candidatus Scybalousia scybalohippi]